MRNSHYYRLTELGPQLTRLRNPTDTKRLAWTYYGGLIVAPIALALAYYNDWFILVYALALIVSMVTWIMIRLTIDAKDIAPREELDDYELEILDRARERAFNLISAYLGIGATVCIFGTVLLDEHLTPWTVGLFAGMWMLMTYLVFTSIPAVTFAYTFNRNPED